MKKSKNLMNRSQKRLMEKQLKVFYEKFSCFNIFQLTMIRDLINDLIIKKGGVNDE